MKAVTLRNIPSDLARAIARQASAKGTSINKAVLSLLAEKLGLSRKPPALYNDLNKLAGRWSREETVVFEKSLAKQRQIDPEIWKK